MSFVREVSLPIQKLGAAFYFVDETLAHGKTLGLGGRRFYFVGRGGALGDVGWPVVASAFGYFNPALIEHIWTTSLEKIQPSVAAREYDYCSQEFGRSRFSTVPGLEAFCESAQAVHDSVEFAGLTLFAGMAGAPLADDPAARAYQLITRLREHRGSAHLLAIVAAGLDPRTAHAIRRPDDLEIFGWTQEDIPPISDEQRAQHVLAEEMTDRIVSPAYEVLDEDAQRAFVQTLTAMRAALRAA